jgi:hypothetical protein
MEDDAELAAHLKGFLHEYIRASDIAATRRMEGILADTEAVGPEIPGCCHPFYLADRDLVVDWLEGGPRTQGWFKNTLYLPKRHTPMFLPPDSPLAREPTLFDHHALQRLLWVGPAPYVGTPFLYVWHVAEDSLHRVVTSEAKIEHDAHRLRLDGPGRWR